MYTESLLLFIIFPFAMQFVSIRDGRRGGVTAKQLTLSNIQERLQKLCEATEYQIIQKNGQRVYQRNPAFDNLTPEKGSEVFVAKLSKYLLEDEIVPLFASIGPIYNVRFMLDFQGYSRGYCFVSYYYQKHSYEAVRRLNNAKIGSHTTRIIVNKSLDNRRLFIGNIPIEKSREEILSVLSMYTEGIENIILYPSREYPRQNRGYVFIEYKSHQEAALARKLLSPGSLTVWGVPLTADWADPVPEVAPEIMSELNRLFIRNIDAKLTYDEILRNIRKYVPPQHLLRLYTKYDYAFLHLVSKPVAEEALKTLQGKQFGSNKVDVEWARPPIYSKANRDNNVPTSFCMAVPPHLRRQVRALKKAKSEANISFSQPPLQLSSAFQPQFDLWNHKGVDLLKEIL